MMSRKKGDSFSNQVIKRLLNALFENGKMKKTSLAANAGINYYMCVKYAKFLAKIGWIEIRPDKSNNDNDVYEYLSITFEGRQKLAILNSEDSSEDNNAAINKSNNNTIIVEDQVFSPSEIDEKICSNNDYYPPAPKIDYVSQNDKIKLLRSSPFLVSMMKGYNHNHHAHSVTSYAKTKANANLMIVDDDTDILLVYNLLLDSCGYNVRVFSDPIEALIHFAKNSSLYDLLILDIRMPQLNGIQLFQTIKSINPNVKVIFVSCLDATPELVSILSEVKQDEILRKPITSEHLIETVQRALS
ncbi:MAG TPA: response regulator [Nitrososphaeraceae archaeon]|nr:response regulator [Nitrososphaeraceae archaeon]